MCYYWAVKFLMIYQRNGLAAALQSLARYSIIIFIQVRKLFVSVAAPSSSGPGRQVLILKIRGSTPLGVTILEIKASSEAFSMLYVISILPIID